MINLWPLISKQTVILSLCFFLTFNVLSANAQIVDWPSDVSIEAEGGIVMDMDSGAVIYGKNMHEHYFPASITKVLTALIVLENCDLNEVVTFSHNAVYNVEYNSSNANLEEGDQLSAQDCLYALLLKSANEAANALAEHVAGSNEAFALMMNEKARELGCVDSNFVNPSGLNDPGHYTSAYDMALITKAAFENETFVKIDSSLYYDLPITKRNPEGNRIYPGHRMLKKSEPVYYPGIIGGKTGYTTKAGNTLVTVVQKDEMTLGVVILNGHMTHYSDTKTLLDFGFANFKSLKVKEYDNTYTSLNSDLMLNGIFLSEGVIFSIDTQHKITIPESAVFADVTSILDYPLSDEAPEHAIASVQYTYDGHEVGTAYLLVERRTLESDVDVTAAISEETVFQDSTAAEYHISANHQNIWLVLLCIIGLIGLLCIIVFTKMYLNKKEEIQRQRRKKQRLARFKDSNLSSQEFDLLMEQRRLNFTKKDKRFKK